MKRLAFLLSLAVACSNKEYLRSAPIEGGGIHVTPDLVFVSGRKLSVRAIVYNGTQEPVALDRDMIGVKLPDGTVVPRYESVTAGHTTQQIAPGAAETLTMVFVEKDFAWHKQSSMLVDFGNGLSQHGVTLQVPPLVVAP